MKKIITISALLICATAFAPGNSVPHRDERKHDSVLFNNTIPTFDKDYYEINDDPCAGCKKGYVYCCLTTLICCAYCCAPKKDICERDMPTLPTSSTHEKMN